MDNQLEFNNNNNSILKDEDGNKNENKNENENDNVTPDNNNTELNTLVEKLFDKLFRSIFGDSEYNKKNFDPRIKEEFEKKFETNFPNFKKKEITEVAEKTGVEEENIEKAMLAFNAMFDENGIEGYEKKLAETNKNNDKNKSLLNNTSNNNIEENDPKLKKFIETRELILSGNKKIINKFLKEYDKIKNSRYAKKIIEYQKNYSEKKERANIITKLNNENNKRIEKIQENEEKIKNVRDSIEEINKKILEVKDNIEAKKKNLRKLGFSFFNSSKEAKTIKQEIKKEEYIIKKMRNKIKEAEKEIKKAEKINEDHKKEIYESVKKIKKNYHKGKVELKYKDLKGKESMEIKKSYEEKVENKVCKNTEKILNNKYEGKHFNKLKEAKEKFRKEYRKNISSSKKIEKIIMKNKANKEISKNVQELNKYLGILKEIEKESDIKNSTILPCTKKEKQDNQTQQQ